MYLWTTTALLGTYTNTATVTRCQRRRQDHHRHRHRPVHRRRCARDAAHGGQRAASARPDRLRGRQHRARALPDDRHPAHVHLPRHRTTASCRLTNVVVTDVTRLHSEAVLGRRRPTSATSTGRRARRRRDLALHLAGVTALTAVAGLHPTRRRSPRRRRSARAAPSARPTRRTTPVSPVGIVVKKAINAAKPDEPDDGRGRERPGQPRLPRGRIDGHLHLPRLRLERPRRSPARRSSSSMTTARPGNTADDFHPIYVSGDKNGNGILDKTEVWLYTATAHAPCPGSTATSRPSTATVDKARPTSPTIWPATTASPSRSVKKATNAVNPLRSDRDRGGRHDRAASCTSPIGSAVIWTYRVTNTGNSPLKVDHELAPTVPAPSPRSTSPATRTATALLDPGETWLYTSAGVVEPHRRRRAVRSPATVTATERTSGTTATASDASDHFGAINQISVVRRPSTPSTRWHPTAYEDANYAPGPVLVAGLDGHVDLPRDQHRQHVARRHGRQDDNGTGDPDFGFVANRGDSSPTGSSSGDTNHERHARPGRDLALHGHRDRRARPVRQHRDGVRRRCSASRRRRPRDHRDRRRQPVRRPTGTARIHVDEAANGQIRATPTGRSLVAAGQHRSRTRTWSPRRRARRSATSRSSTTTARRATLPTTCTRPTSRATRTTTALLDPGETWMFTARRTPRRTVRIANVVRVSGQAPAGTRLGRRPQLLARRHAGRDDRQGGRRPRPARARPRSRTPTASPPRSCSSARPPSGRTS